MDSSTPQHTLQDACTMYYAHSGGFSPLENGLFNTTAYTARYMYYVLCTQWRIQSTREWTLQHHSIHCKMHVLCTMHTVADSVHLRMDSSTPEHTLQDACTICTMYTVADSVHLRMDSSTPQHPLQDACTMYYAHSGGFSPLENGLFNTTAYTARCMYYVLCTQWRIQST